MRLLRCSPLWAVNKVAQNICTSWRPLLLPAMFWFGISGGTQAAPCHARDAGMRLTRSSFPASSPRLATSRRGGALALWCEGGCASQSLWGSRYLPGPGWEKPVHLGTAVGDEGEARAALNSQGAATVLWIQTANRVRHLLAVSYTPGAGWGSPALLDSTGLVLAPQVLLDEEGNALAAWHRLAPAGNRYHFLCARRTPGGWSSPSVLGSDQLVPTGCISGNGSGAAVALWNGAAPGSSANQMSHNTWVRRLYPRQGWGPPLALGREIVHDEAELSPAQTVPGHHAPIISLNASGDALALWQEVSAPGMDYRLKVARLEGGKGWSAPQQIAENPLVVSAALSDGGVASVGITQGAGWPDLDVYMSSLTVATDMGLGWFSEKVLDNYPYFCLSPSLALGKEGQPLVTWVKGSGDERELWSATRSISGWSSGNRLDEEGCVEQYEAGCDEGGNVIVVWTEKSATGRTVWGRVVPV